MPVREAPVVPIPERSGGGLFGGKKRLEAENAQLREWVERLGGLDAMQITAATEQLRAEQARLQAAIQDADHRLREIETQIVQTEDVALLQEVGVYEYQHGCSSSVVSWPVRR